MSQHLHDRATRGEQLTADEMAQLDAWYARNDQQEANELSVSANSEPLDDLRRQLDAALAELAETSQRVRRLASGNQAIREENNILRQQLATRSTTHSA